MAVGARPAVPNLTPEPAVPELTPEQEAFLRGLPKRSWRREGATIVVLAQGPVRGPIPRGITIRSVGNRQRRRTRTGRRGM